MDALSDILSLMKLSGTLYFRTSFTSPWSIAVPPYEDVARFHFAHRGRCLVRVEGAGPPVLLEQGDLIVITRGASHTLFCDPKTEDLAVKLDDVVRASGFTGRGALVYGEFGSNHETQLVCGHFSFEPNLRHPLIEALPAYIHIRDYGAASGLWLDSTLRVIGAETGRGRMGGDLIATKLSEVIFTQVLRAHLEAEGGDVPVLAGFADPNISRALEAIHEDASQPWSLADLSHIAGLSRTAFANRFSACLTMTPHAYLTFWRMQLARRLLADTHLPIIEVAERVGYLSEAAFGRVFKKQAGIAPARYRRGMARG